MPKKSAGILAFRFRNNELEFFLVHPGGPFWKNKDEGAWTVPKGEFGEDEEPVNAARREFKEETGITISGNLIELGPVKLKSGKLIYIWAIETDFDHRSITSNLFEIEWPPRSEKKQQFPEVDKGAWLNLADAKKKINANLFDLLAQVVKLRGN